jgi:Holliday junction DNA helicase RuvA
MIGSLSGTITHKQGQELWLDVSGVGYRVFCGERLLARSVLGQALSLWIHTRVREVALELFGFEDVASLNIFERLLDASGVGPKTALAIVGSSTGEAIAQAIATADVDFFRQFKGVGAKGAQRIIVDLKNKVGDFGALFDGEGSEHQDEALEALLQLGFDRKSALATLKNIDDSLPTETRVMQALKKRL